MEGSELLYSPPFEEDDSSSMLVWEKQTIQYAIENKSKLISYIHSLIRKMMDFDASEIEDIFSSTIEYLLTTDDYDNQKGIERSKNGASVTLDGYVKFCTKCVTLRYISSNYHRNKMLASNIVTDEDGKEDDLVDSIADEKSLTEYDQIYYDFEENLKNIEYKRYKYGIDIFLIIYVRLLTQGYEDSIYENILEVLGVSTKTLRELGKKVTSDEDILHVIKSVDINDNEAAVISALEERVYASRILKTAINEVLNAS